MPNKNAEFPVFCSQHYKNHKAHFPKHLGIKQSYVGISWVDDKFEENNRNNK